ncbi:hypothetical protein PTKIN_Ptkin09bG0045400 [Pterospermum kingtungense]
MIPTMTEKQNRKLLMTQKLESKVLLMLVSPKIPRMFIAPPNLRAASDTKKIKFSVPVIDLEGVGNNPQHHKEIIDKVRHACETAGFFQVVNHGVPLSILEEMKDGVGRFFELDVGVKKEFYTRDPQPKRRFRYSSNFDLYTAPFANWRDTCFCIMAPDPPKPEELPSVLRDIQPEYTNRVMRLGSCLFKLLSEALGLKPSYLEEMGCADGLSVLCHYYPPCPEPELTFGISRHSDNDFLTVLLQDQIGGLQVFYQDQWVDAPPVPGALVVNIGDLLQILRELAFMFVGCSAYNK